MSATESPLTKDTALISPSPLPDSLTVTGQGVSGSSVPATTLTGTNAVLDSLTSSIASSSGIRSSSTSPSSTTSSPSASPTASAASDNHQKGWSMNIVGPVVAIAGALLLLSIIARFYSLCSRRRKKNRQTSSLLGADEFDDGDDQAKVAAGGFVVRDVARTPTVSAAGKYGSPTAHLSYHQLGYGTNRETKYSAEPGYNDEELFGDLSTQRQTGAHNRAWNWMRKTFTNEDAFGEKYRRGPPIRRSVLSFVNLSPFAQHASSSAKDEESRHINNARLWGSPPAGWYDASVPSDTRSPPPPTPPAKSPHQVPRRPIKALSAYTPLATISDRDEPRSIDAILADNRGQGQGQGQGNGTARMPSGFTARLPGWRETIRRISGGKPCHQINSGDATPGEDGCGKKEPDCAVDHDDGADERADTSTSAFQKPVIGNAYRRVSRGSENGEEAESTIRRAATHVNRSRTKVGRPLTKHASMAALVPANTTAATLRTPTITIVSDSPCVRRKEGDGRLTRSPSKYPGGDAASFSTVDTETLAVLAHLDPSPSETPGAERVISFENVSKTPEPLGSLSLQRQGTISSFASVGTDSKREQRLRRAETVVQNAVKRASANEGGIEGKLRRAVTSASDNKAPGTPSRQLSERSSTQPSGPSRSPSSSASTSQPSRSIYKTARRALMTQTPDVPQLRSVLSDAEGSEFPDSRDRVAEPSSSVALDRVPTRSDYSSDDGPPSLVHGSSASSSDAEDEVPEMASATGHITTSKASKQASLTADEQALDSKWIAPALHNADLTAYHATMDVIPVAADLAASMQRLDKGMPDLNLSSPLASASKPSPARTIKAPTSLSPKKSILKVTQSNQRMMSPGETTEAGRRADADDEEPERIELHDPPVGPRRADSPNKYDLASPPQTPSKKRSWKQRNGRWIADESEDKGTNHSILSPNRSFHGSPTRQDAARSFAPASPPKAVTTLHRTDNRDSLEARLLDAKLHATMSPDEANSGDPFGKHADLFFSPPLGSAINSGTRTRSPQHRSPARAPTTRTRDILAADTVRTRAKSTDSYSNASGGESILSPSSSSYVAPTPTAADALMSLAFSPHASDAESYMQSYRDNASDGYASSHTSPSRRTPHRRPALNRPAGHTPSEKSADAHSAISTDLHYRGDQSSLSSSSRTIEQSKKMTKSSMTLASQFSAVAESTWSSNQEALTDAEERGRAGLDDALSMAWKSRADAGV